MSVKPTGGTSPSAPEPFSIKTPAQKAWGFVQKTFSSLKNDLSQAGQKVERFVSKKTGMFSSSAQTKAPEMRRITEEDVLVLRKANKQAIAELNQSCAELSALLRGR